MKIIVGGRASGKTTRLIQESAETGRRILTFNEGAARCICWQAQNLGYDIPMPLSVKVWEQLKVYPETKEEIKKEGLIIDDLETTLSALCGAAVHAATFCCENAPLIEIDTRGNMKMFYNKNNGTDNYPQPKFKQGESVFVIEPEYNVRSMKFEKCVKEYKIRKVFVNKKSVSYLLYGKKYRAQEQFLYETYEDAEKALNRNENI